MIEHPLPGRPAHSAPRAWTAAGIVLLALVAARPAHAQQPPSAGRLEVTGAAGLLAGSTLGAQQASLRANSPSPQPFRVFTTDSKIAPTLALEVRAGAALTARYGIEGGVSFGRPELRTTVSADVEDAPGIEVSERLHQYLFDAGAFVLLQELRFSTLVPVVSGGVGYLRQLHEGRTLVEEGRFFHVGVGIRRLLATRPRGLLRGTGVRADWRLYIVDGGVAVDGGLRTQGALTGGVFVVF